MPVRKYEKVRNFFLRTRNWETRFLTPNLLADIKKRFLLLSVKLNFWLNHIQFVEFIFQQIKQAHAKMSAPNKYWNLNVQFELHQKTLWFHSIYSMPFLVHGTLPLFWCQKTTPTKNQKSNQINIADIHAFSALKSRVDGWKSLPMIYISLNRELNSALNDMHPQAIWCATHATPVSKHSTEKIWTCNRNGMDV